MAIFWRAGLIGILVITLIGSIVAVITEPNSGTFLGLLGSIGGVMGSFVTTGLDVTAKRQAAASMPTSEAAPMVAPATTPTQRGINISAILKASTIGALIAGLMGLFSGLGGIGLICFCIEWMIFFGIGAAYTYFARRDLPVGERLTNGSTFMGAGLSALMPAAVGVAANCISFWLLFPTGQAAQQVVLTVTIMLCGALLIMPILSGAAGLVASTILKENRTA